MHTVHGTVTLRPICHSHIFRSVAFRTNVCVVIVQCAVGWSILQIDRLWGITFIWMCCLTAEPPSQSKNNQKYSHFVLVVVLIYALALSWLQLPFSHTRCTRAYPLQIKIFLCIQMWKNDENWNAFWFGAHSLIGSEALLNAKENVVAYPQVNAQPSYYNGIVVWFKQ